MREIFEDDMDKRTNNDLLGWLGFHRYPSFRKSPALGGLLGVILTLVVGFVAFAGIAALVHFLMAVLRIGPYEAGEVHSAIRNIGLVLAAVFGAPFIAWRSMVAHRQAEIAEESHTTDRINKAVENLGATRVVKRQRRRETGKLAYEHFEKEMPPRINPDKPIFEEVSEPNLEVRIGAIYALERIARQNLDYHLQATEIISAFVRTNAPQLTLQASTPPFQPTTPRQDIQTAISVLARRSKQQIKIENDAEFRIDLKNTDLSGIDFGAGQFSAAMFNNSRLEAASFKECQLHGTVFNGSLLNFADFWGAELVGTRFNEIEISQGVLWGSFTGAAKVKGLTFIGANLTGLDSIHDDIFQNRTLGTKDTQLNDRDEGLPPEFPRLASALRSAVARQDPMQISEAEAVLRSTGFRYWCPYTKDDLALGSYLDAFYNEMGLKGFPYL